MRCVTDLTSVVSTNSLPSTLLKKTSQRKQQILSPYHDRVKSQQQQQQQERHPISMNDSPVRRNDPRQQDTHFAKTSSIKDADLHQTHRTRPPSPERGINYRSSVPKTTIGSSQDTNYHEEQYQYSMARSPYSHQNHLSSGVGRTSSDDVLCSRDDDEDIPYDRTDNDEDDDDDDHRYIVTITTSRSTIKACGGKDPRRNYIPAAASLLSRKAAIVGGNHHQLSTTFHNFSELDDESSYYSTTDGDVSDQNLPEFRDETSYDPIYQEHGSVHNPYTLDDSIHPLELQSQQKKAEKETFTSSSETSRKSGSKLSTIVSEQSREQTTSSSVPTSESYYNENSVTISNNRTSVGGRTRSSSSNQSRSGSNSRSDNHAYNGLTASADQLGFEHQIIENTIDISQSVKSLSSTRFLSNELEDRVKHDNGAVDDDEQQRENDIRSAAASRKTGKSGGKSGKQSQSTSSSSRNREVLIEEYEKPLVIQDMNHNHTAAPLVSASNNKGVWKKIEDVLFADDLSELHLFKTPAKDVTFDDLLTTTSDCSSISVSLDPSGKIVNDMQNNSQHHHHPITISNVQFDRVKSVLDRMKKPIVVHTTGTPPTTAGATARTAGNAKHPGLVSYNAPKTKNRVGTSNFVQNNNYRMKQQPVPHVQRTNAIPNKNVIRSQPLRPEQQSQGVTGVRGTSDRIITNEDRAHSTLRGTPIPSSQLHQIGYNDRSMNTVSYPTSSLRKDPPAHTLCSEPY